MDAYDPIVSDTLERHRKGLVNPTLTPRKYKTELVEHVLVKVASHLGSFELHAPSRLPTGYESEITSPYASRLSRSRVYRGWVGRPNSLATCIDAERLEQLQI